MGNEIGIYKITSPVGKIYIGQSRNIYRRIRDYKKMHCKNQPHLYNSFKKYGTENHQFETLEHCSVDIINEREIYFINLYRSTYNQFGLNCKEGGVKGKFTDEVRAKMSEKAQGGKSPMEGKKHSLEVRLKMSELKKGKTTYKKGQKVSEVERARLRMIRIERTTSPETRAKMSKSMMGKNCKKVINTSNGKVYDAVYLAADELGIKHTTLIAMLRGQNFNRTTLKYL